MASASSPAPPAAAPAPAPPAASAYANDAARLASEKAEKDRALQEKLDKRAAVVAGVLRKFISGFYAGRQQELDAARAAEAAKKAAKGKKAKKKKKEDKNAKGGDKGGKPKKPPPTPVQQAWQTFLADMDDRINKQKRVFLEDMYRGVAALDQREQSLLSAALVTTTNKILPLDGLNINQLNIKEAVAAGCAACALSASTALPSTCGMGLHALRDRGATVAQVLEYGYHPQAALRAGYPCHSVVEASQHHLRDLKQAGVRPGELVRAPEAPELAADLTQGLRGITLLKEAGYTAHDLVSSKLDNAWALAHAGFSMQELQQAGVTAPDTLRAAGFGDPDAQPVTFLALSTLHKSVDPLSSNTLPPRWTGTQEPRWQAILDSMAPPPATLPPSTAQTRRQQAAATAAAAAATAQSATPA